MAACPSAKKLATKIMPAAPATKAKFEYRWIVVQAAGTGFDWHVDPYKTCAWNVLMYGEGKRWWFCECDPRGSGTSSSSLSNSYTTPILEVTQYPGEGIFIPAGWWHKTETLGTCQPSLAFTQNFCFEFQVRAVVGELRRLFGHRGKVRGYDYWGDEQVVPIEIRIADEICRRYYEECRI